MDLPYSVQRGEIIAIPVIVFNYLSSDVSVDVTMENIGEFEFSDFSNDLETPPAGNIKFSHELNNFLVNQPYTFFVASVLDVVQQIRYLF